MQYINGQNFKHQSNCLSSLARCKSAWGWDQAFAKDHLTEKNFGLHISRSRPSVRTSNSLILWWSWSPSLRSQPPQIGLRTFPCKKRLHVTTPFWCFFKQRPMESTSSQPVGKESWICQPPSWVWLKPQILYQTTMKSLAKKTVDQRGIYIYTILCRMYV